MAVEYCHRGDHYIDLDYNVEGCYNKKLQWVCFDCMTDEEAERLDNAGNPQTDDKGVYLDED